MNHQIATEEILKTLAAFSPVAIGNDHDLKDLCMLRLSRGKIAISETRTQNFEFMRLSRSKILKLFK